ncbi:MAG TPA: C2H2-type zinc finger protein [Blastocatellia bacterium]|jgi:DNA-directed RNA polymerase subunit RPC12/RpoP|nr:C2H2-type zinc finger protein [Blastocatellia bacterium]
MAQSNQPMYKCSTCGESFDSQSDLREHEKSCKQKGATATTKNQ